MNFIDKLEISFDEKIKGEDAYITKYLSLYVTSELGDYLNGHADYVWTGTDGITAIFTLGGDIVFSGNFPSRHIDAAKRQIEIIMRKYN